MKTVRIASLFVVFSLALLLQTGSFAQGKKGTQQPQIVAKILKVEYVEEEINPPNLVVMATGQVPTGGFTRPTLVRATYVVPPADGIQDYFLLAVPPSGPAIQVISEVKATDRWKGYTKEAPWLKGIRVHGVGDGIVVKMIAGAEKKHVDKWRAWAVTNGKKTKLTVEGIYSQGGPGLVALVEPAVPQGINPKILILEVKTATLPGTWPTILEPIPASYVKTPYKKDQYDSVDIRYPDGTIVHITKIIDAGDGPKIHAEKDK